MISELEIVEGESFYNGEKYSGVALKKDNLDNIRVEKKYNDGIKFYIKSFYSEDLCKVSGFMETENYCRYIIKVVELKAKKLLIREMVRNGTSYLYYRMVILKVSGILRTD